MTPNEFKRYEQRYGPKQTENLALRISTPLKASLACESLTNNVGEGTLVRYILTKYFREQGWDTNSGCPLPEGAEI